MAVVKASATHGSIAIERVTEKQASTKMGETVELLNEEELDQLVRVLSKMHREIKRDRLGRGERLDGWLSKIENLKPGDACEFRYPARVDWLPGVVVVNGGAGFWSVRDESDAEGCRGKVTRSIYIEHVRLPGQTEAWPR